MYHTIKTLLNQGRSERWISRELGIHRKTVKRLSKEVKADELPKSYARASPLSGYEQVIQGYLDQELSYVLIHQRLLSDHGLSVSYSSVRRYASALSGPGESFVPMQSEAGEEAQVDFGYLGLYTGEDGRKVKVWGFSLVLSHSRYAYHEAVLDQRVDTFLRCHRHAFEFFGGVPQRVKLDNLKSGVITPDFYEPLLQEQYAEMLAHYGAAGVACRVRTPQHKGKVESGVKYVKGNFVRGLRPEDRRWPQLQVNLRHWTETVCNARRHGTTHRIPAEVFEQVERPALLPLPAQRYELFRWEERKVGRFGHIHFDCNYYSVPNQWLGQTLRVKSNESLVWIYAGQQEVALHPRAKDKGVYITRQEHLPPHKQEQSLESLQQSMLGISPDALAFLEACREHDPHHWKDKVRGVLSLRKSFASEQIGAACQQALEARSYSYRTVGEIVRRLADAPAQPPPHAHELLISDQGYHHDLAAYDQL